jgi:hypothetical protein
MRFSEFFVEVADLLSSTVGDPLHKYGRKRNQENQAPTVRRRHSERGVGTS